MKPVTLLITSLLFTGCTTNPLSLLEPEKGITAQVGHTNTKQGVGLTNTNKEEVTNGNLVKDNKSLTVEPAKKVTTKETGSIGTVQSEHVTINNGSNWFLIAGVLGSLLLVLVFLYFLLRKGGKHD